MKNKRNNKNFIKMIDLKQKQAYPMKQKLFHFQNT